MFFGVSPLLFSTTTGAGPTSLKIYGFPSLNHIHSWKHESGISCVVCNKTFQILMGKQLSTLLVRSHQLIPQGCMQRQKTLIMWTLVSFIDPKHTPRLGSGLGSGNETKWTFALGLLSPGCPIAM